MSGPTVSRRSGKPSDEDWLSWGILLHEALASGRALGTTTAPQVSQGHSTSKNTWHRNERKAYRISDGIPNDEGMLATPALKASDAGLHVLSALCSSGRLRDECSKEFVDSLRIIVRVLSCSIVGNPAYYTDNFDESLTDSDSHAHPPKNRPKSHSSASRKTPIEYLTEGMCSYLESQNERIATVAMSAEDADSCIRLKWNGHHKEEAMKVATLSSILESRRFKTTMALRRLQRMSRKVDNKKEELVERKNPLNSFEQANEARQWDMSVLEKEISKAKASARAAEAKALKMLKERKFYATASELKEAQADCLELERQVKDQKAHYEKLLKESCSEAELASSQEKRTSRVSRESSGLQLEHKYWFRTNTPRPKVRDLLSQNDLNTWKSDQMQDSIACRLSHLEDEYRKHLIGLSAEVRRAYQTDTGGDFEEEFKPQNLKESLVQQRFSLMKEGKPSMSQFEDALGGVASYSLRNALLRIRVSLDGAVSTLFRNQRMHGLHRSEKIVKKIDRQKPACFDVETDIDSDNEDDPNIRKWEHTKSRGETRGHKRQVIANDCAEHSWNEPKNQLTEIQQNDLPNGNNPKIPMSTSTIANRLADLVRVLKLIRATEESMQLRESIIKKASELNAKLALFDRTLENHRIKQENRKKHSKFENSLGGDCIDDLLSHLDIKLSEKVGEKHLCFKVKSLGSELTVPLFLRSGEIMHAGETASFSTLLLNTKSRNSERLVSTKEFTEIDSSTIISVRKMDIHKVRQVLDKLWSKRLGAISASGGISNSSLFVDAEGRKRASSIRASEALQHLDLKSSSSEYDSDENDPEIHAKLRERVAKRKRIHDQLMESRRDSSFLPIDEFARNFFEDEAMLRMEAENHVEGKERQGKVGIAKENRRLRGLIEAYSFWWSAQLICTDEHSKSKKYGITQDSCGVNFIRMSRLVLAGILPQEVISDSMRMLRALRTFVVSISRREMGVPAPAKLVYKDNLFASLGRFFPTATHESGTDSHALSSVVDTIERENPNSCVVGVAWLFATSSPLKHVKKMTLLDRQLYACRADEYSSPFIESILAYYIEGSTKYGMRLLGLMHAMNPAGDGKLTPSMIAYCLHHILSRFHVSQGRVLLCMAIGMGLDTKMVNFDPRKAHSSSLAEDVSSAAGANIKKPAASKIPFSKMKKKKPRFKTKAAKLLHIEKKAKEKRRKARKEERIAEKARWRALLAHPEAVVGLGFDELPTAWMNELGSDQSTKRVNIETFWRRLVSKHVYRPSKFYFPGAEPTLRYKEIPDQPRAELSTLRVMLDSRGRAVYNDGRCKKFLASDKEGKSMNIIEAATTVGYTLVGLRTPRRRKNAEQLARLAAIRKEKEEAAVAAAVASKVEAFGKKRRRKRSAAKRMKAILGTNIN